MVEDQNKMLDAEWAELGGRSAAKQRLPVQSEAGKWRTSGRPTWIVIIAILAVLAIGSNALCTVDEADDEAIVETCSADFSLKGCNDFMQKKKLLRDNEEMRLKHRRVKRDIEDDFGPPNICSMMEEEVQGLKWALNSAAQTLTQENNNKKVLSCENGNDENKCSQIVCQIKNQAYYIVKQIEMLSENYLSSGSESAYLNLLDAFRKMHESEMEKNAKMFDDMKRELEQKEAQAKAEIEELNSINERLKNENNEHSAKIINDLIQSGNNEKAYDEFSRTKGWTFMDKIAKHVSEADASNLKILIDFIDRCSLPVSQKEQKFLMVFEELKKLKQVDDSIALYFYYVLDKNNNQFPSLKPKLRSHIGPILSKWASWVRSEDYKQIKVFSKQYFDTFEFHLPELIKMVYTNKLENFDKIISFLEYIDNPKSAATGLLALYEEMERNGHLDSSELVFLACHLKNSPMPVDRSSKKIDEIKSKLPKNIQRLLFDEDVLWIHTTIRLGFYAFLKKKRINIILSNGKSFNDRLEIKMKYENRKCYFAFTFLHGSALAASSINEWRTYIPTPYSENSDFQFWEVTPFEEGDYVSLKNKANGKFLEVNNIHKFSGNHYDSVYGIYPDHTSDIYVEKSKWQFI